MFKAKFVVPNEFVQHRWLLFYKKGTNLHYLFDHKHVSSTNGNTRENRTASMSTDRVFKGPSLGRWCRVISLLVISPGRVVKQHQSALTARSADHLGPQLGRTSYNEGAIISKLISQAQPKARQLIRSWFRLFTCQTPVSRGFGLGHGVIDLLLVIWVSNLYKRKATKKWINVYYYPIITIILFVFGYVGEF